MTCSSTTWNCALPVHFCELAKRNLVDETLAFRQPQHEKQSWSSLVHRKASVFNKGIVLPLAYTQRSLALLATTNYIVGCGLSSWYRWNWTNRVIWKIPSQVPCLHSQLLTLVRQLAPPLYPIRFLNRN